MKPDDKTERIKPVEDREENPSIERERESEAAEVQEPQPTGWAAQLRQIMRGSLPWKPHCAKPWRNFPARVRSISFELFGSRPAFDGSDRRLAGITKSISPSAAKNCSHNDSLS